MVALFNPFVFCHKKPDTHQKPILPQHLKRLALRENCAPVASLHRSLSLNAQNKSKWRAYTGCGGRRLEVTRLFNAQPASTSPSPHSMLVRRFTALVLSSHQIYYWEILGLFGLHNPIVFLQKVWHPSAFRLKPTFYGSKRWGFQEALFFGWFRNFRTRKIDNFWWFCK